MVDIHRLGASLASVVASPAVVIPGVLMPMMGRSVRRARASRAWPSVTGRVLSAGVGSHRTPDSHGLHRTIYAPAVVYEDAVEQQRYEATRVDLSGVGGTSAAGWARAVVDRYPAGGAVRVFYDPAEAALQNTTGRGEARAGHGRPVRRDGRAAGADRRGPDRPPRRVTSAAAIAAPTTAFHV